MDPPLLVDNGDLGWMVEAAGGGGEIEPHSRGEAVDGRRVGGGEQPVLAAGVVLRGEAPHTVRRVALRVEPDSQHVEAAPAESCLRYATGRREVLDDQGADVSTSGVDQRNEQRFAAEAR